MINKSNEVKNNRRGNYQSHAGITLIALVVTIIVLLILAGIAINLTVGNNGLFARAKNAANTWREAEANEASEMQSFANTYDETLKNLGLDGSIEEVPEGPITVEYAKTKINSSNIQKYIGKEVEYNSPKGGTWRVFYYDEEGYFGRAKTVYLKRDYDANLKTKLTLSIKTENEKDESKVGKFKL